MMYFIITVGIVLLFVALFVAGSILMAKGPDAIDRQLDKQLKEIAGEKSDDERFVQKTVYKAPPPTDVVTDYNKNRAAMRKQGAE